ncbi:MAG TPA: MATE family efflux transporter [Rectinemataceae bacterium]|nr:MATE family efflux transporter [Rectinemataceae bacterium]
MEHSDAQYVKMTQTPVGKLVTSLAVPTIVSMLVSSIYNMADTYFVSKISTSASAAVGIVFSLMAIIQAVGFTIGMGSGSWISRLLGAHKTDDANVVASSGFFMSILFGILLAVFGVVFMNPLMQVLGATETILPYASDYASYILIAAPIMMASFVLNNILRAEGKAKFAMIGIATGGILNCGLDPLFIFTFKMGIGGAAIATALSQLISFIILLAVYLGGGTIVKIGAGKMAKRPDTYLRILKNGLPSFCRQGLASASTVALNVSAALYGDAAVAAMSIVAKIFMFIFSIVLGVGQGYQPVVGYNYGAKKMGRVREAFFFTLKTNVAVMTSCAVAGYMTAPTLMRLFISQDVEVIRIGTIALRAQCLTMPLLPLGVMCNMTFQSIGKSWTATILSAARQGIFFLPLILVLPRFFGLFGVQITQPLADVCAFLFCLPFTFHFFKELRTNDA